MYMSGNLFLTYHMITPSDPTSPSQLLYHPVHILSFPRMACGFHYRYRNFQHIPNPHNAS